MKPYSNEEVRELLSEAFDRLDARVWVTIKECDNNPERLDLMAGIDMLELLREDVDAILDNDMKVVEAYNNG